MPVAVDSVLPIVIVPVLGMVVGLADTDNDTFPLYVPVEPLVMLIHASLLAADHWQPAPVLTLKVPVPPLPEIG